MDALDFAEHAASEPLLGGEISRPIVRRQGQAVSGARILHAAWALAETLPDRPYVLNLCENRYRFLVGFAAALLRGQVSLLPPNRAPLTLRRLAEAYPGAYCLTDCSDVPDGLQRFVCPPDTARIPSHRPRNPLIPADQIAAIAFTSGTTGQSQPHAKSWRTLRESARLIGESLGIPAGSHAAFVATVPPQHMYGLETTILVPFCHGGTLHEGKPFFPEDVRLALESVPAPRILITTPVHLRACLEEDQPLPPLEFIVSATAPLPAPLAQTAERLCRTRVLEIYGCTEAGSIACRRTIDGPLWQSFEGVRLVDTGRGSRCVEADHLPQPIALNDVIALYDAGRFSLHGRDADLVNIAGKRTSLGALNQALCEIEGVRDGAFYMPEETGARTVRLTAFAVAPSVPREHIMQELKSRIDPVFLPRPLYRIDSLPRTATGKLTRQALQDLAARMSGSRQSGGND
jgi:acyl-coenzyme A synthetase/AMP-(fatty) acid ligase